MKKLLSKTEFIRLSRHIQEPVYSITGRASYSNFSIAGNMLQFRRDKKGTAWALDLDTLYDVYTDLDFINTVRVRPYFYSGRIYSPACAVLIAMGLYNSKGNKY